MMKLMQFVTRFRKKGGGEEGKEKRKRNYHVRILCLLAKVNRETNKLLTECIYVTRMYF